MRFKRLLQHRADPTLTACHTDYTDYTDYIDHIDYTDYADYIPPASAA
jgi:hypothetical protein